jgi:hypothetical protein
MNSLNPRKMKLRKAILSIFMAGVVMACSSISVTTDYDKSVDFNTFKTYSFYQWKAGTSEKLSEFDKQRLKEAVGKELDKRGYKYVEEDGTGDLTVSLFVVLEEKTSRTAYTDHYGDGYYGYDAWGYGASRTTYVENEYVYGTLVIDIFSTATRKLVWQGIGAGVVEEKPSTRQEKIPGEVAQIFKEFPKPITTP